MKNRATRHKIPIVVKRAMITNKPEVGKRAIFLKKPENNKRATAAKKPTGVKRATETDRIALRLALRAREDFQMQRKRMDNRLGIKADGTDQDISERMFSGDDLAMFTGIAKAAREQEECLEKNLAKILKRFPIWNEYLSKIPGVGTIAGSVIISSFDIVKATTVSKMWQYAGLNPGMVIGKKRVENKDGTFSLVPTSTMIRGDKLTPGFVSPFNKQLRVALCGVLADGFVKLNGGESKTGSKRTLSKYRVIYDQTKERLANSDQVTQENSGNGKIKDLAWKEAKLAHRDRAAKRKMIKQFLIDLYVAWRTLEGLEVRSPYQEQYLGHKHAA